MAPRRNLILSFLAIVSLFGLPNSLCDAQYGWHHQSYPAAVEHSASSTNAPDYDWRQSRARFASTGMLQDHHWTQPSYSSNDSTSTPVSSTHYLATYSLGRIDAARQSASQYRSRSLPSSTFILDLANTNAALAEKWAELAATINSVSTRVAQANAKLESAKQDYDAMVIKLGRNALTPTIGLLLSHKKNQLEDWQIDGSASHYVKNEIQRSRDQQLENELVVYDGSDVARQSSEILALSGYNSSQPEYAGIAYQVQSLLRERREWLQLLTQGYNDYRQRLGDLDSASTAFDKLTTSYRKLINRHIIWIPSSDPLAFSDMRKLQAGLSSLFDSRRSADFGYSLRQKWISNSASGWKLMGVVSIVLLLRFLAKSWLLGIGKRKRLRETPASLRKCIASVLTVLVALAISGVFYLVARWLGSEYVTDSTLHVSTALYAASLVALVIEIPRQLLRRYGFVEKHLKIELPRQQRAAIYLLVIGTGLVLSAYIVTLAQQIDRGNWSGSIARLGFIASLLLVAWTAHLAFRPKAGFLEPIVEVFGGKVLYRIRLLLYFLGVGFPLAMIALSTFGYEYTATEIVKRASITFVSLLIALTLWSAVKIVSSRLWHRLTGTYDERQTEDYEQIETARVSGALASHSLELKHQMAFLSQCGLVLAAIICIGWLWIDVFPNVRMGNPVVWNVQDTVTRSMIDGSGQRISRSEVETTSITLLHLLLAGATLFVAFQLAKLLPGIFDALVLQRVNFDEAMEHLSLVLGRCLLFGIGCFIACRLIGLRWETIQWLAVGLAVGLGFALQDVVKNLLGGFVVLFEKPAKLGDLITVGNVTGRVSSQKLRTTTLSDEEGREVIIPNKSFVSKDVVNWMGAGRLKAILIEVSVTRDERPADICRMLQQLLVQQPELLLNPAPQATLTCIGQQSQRIELRAWVEGQQDAVHFRDSLTKTVLEFLLEKNLLAPNQPRQPSLNEPAPRDNISRPRTRNKRSA